MERTDSNKFVLDKKVHASGEGYDRTEEESQITIDSYARVYLEARNLYARLFNEEDSETIQIIAVEDLPEIRISITATELGCESFPVCLGVLDHQDLYAVEPITEKNSTEIQVTV